MAAAALLLVHPAPGVRLDHAEPSPTLKPTTTGDQARATGKLGVEPTFDVDIDITWGQIRRFQFTNATRLYLEVFNRSWMVAGGAF
jgi:hypothetical protein